MSVTGDLGRVTSCRKDPRRAQSLAHATSIQASTVDSHCQTSEIRVGRAMHAACARCWRASSALRANRAISLRTHAALLSSSATLHNADSKQRVSEALNSTQISDLLSSPTWDVQSLMPSEADIEAGAEEVSPEQLRHLLRLCALAPPATAEEEARLLRDLRSQLHFVRRVQRVKEAAGVTPLEALRDETRAAAQEEEIGLDAMRDALAAEETVGRFHKRIRRKTTVTDESREAEDWDVLGQAPRRMGRFFVVDRREV